MARIEGDLAAARAEQERRAARKARIRRPGRPPKLSPAQERDIARLYQQGIRTVDELAQDYGIGTSTVYRILTRTDETSTQPANPAIETGHTMLIAADAAPSGTSPVLGNAFIIGLTALSWFGLWRYARPALRSQDGRADRMS